LPEAAAYEIPPLVEVHVLVVSVITNQKTPLPLRQIEHEPRDMEARELLQITAIT
jgi:hypothetical protein